MIDPKDGMYKTPLWAEDFDSKVHPESPQAILLEIFRKRNIHLSEDRGERAVQWMDISGFIQDLKEGRI